MSLEQGVKQIADQYRSQGYQVVVRPEPKDLPDFAKTFKVEIVARRDDESALVSVKMNPKELEADPNIPDYAEVTDKQPGWRFDLYALESDFETKFPDKRDAKEPTDEEVHQQVATVRRLLDANVHQQALVLAWSVLEAAMRRRLQAEGEDAGWGTSPRTMLNELLSAGAVSDTAFRDLERLFQVRNAVVHGFTMPTVDVTAVNLVLDVVRDLLEQSNQVKQPA